MHQNGVGLEKDNPLAKRYYDHGEFLLKIELLEHIFREFIIEILKLIKINKFLKAWMFIFYYVRLFYFVDFQLNSH